MKKIVLLGGNGYIGGNVLRYWLSKNKDNEFYVVSRSGKEIVSDNRVKNIKADVINYDELDKFKISELLHESEYKFGSINWDKNWYIKKS